MSRRVCLICQERANPLEQIALHCVPTELGLRNKWMTALKLNEKDNINSVRVCSKHFKESDKMLMTYSSGKKSIKLTSEAVPSWSLHKIRKTAPVCSHNVPITENQHILPSSPLETAASTSKENIQPESEISSNPSTPKKSRRCFEPRYIGDILTPDVKTTRRARRVLSMVKMRSAEHIRQIKNLEAVNRRLKYS